jgi:hypothetical protein
MPSVKEALFFCDLGVLFRDKNFLRFRTFCGVTVAERINSAFRLVLYVTIGCVLWYIDTVLCLVYIATLTLFVLFGKQCLPVHKRIVVQNVRKTPVKKHNGQECRMPSDANPFGNFMVTDFDDLDRPPACNFEDVQEDIDSKFYKNLYRKR